MTGLLQVKDLKISFKQETVIDEMSFNIKAGALTSILGPSGSGKTTVLKAIAGLNQNITGHIYLDNRDITTLPANQRDIGMIFQAYALFPNLTVFDNIAYGLRVQKQPKAEIVTAVEQMLTLIGLADKKACYPDDLSGGQQQRVAIARAMVLKPKLLLLDEPLSALDAKIRVELRNQIKQYQQKLGITMIFVTHDQAEAIAISDDIIVMNAGKIQQQGSPMAIYAAPSNTFVAKFIGNHNLLSGKQLLTLGFKHVIQEQQYIIRPEQFERGDKYAQNSDAIAIKGRVINAAVLGDRIQYQFQTVSGIVLKAEVLNQSTPLALTGETTLLIHEQDLKKVGLTSVVVLNKQTQLQEQRSQTNEITG